MSNANWGWTLRTRAGIFVSAGMFTCAASAQFPAQNVIFRSNITPADVGAASGSSCWGYTSPSGREYALAGYNNRLTVIEVTNPLAPVVVGSITHTASLWCEVKAYQNYCYVSNEAGGGLDVIDLANVDSGVVTLVRRLTVNGLATIHTVSVDEQSGFLYLNGSNLGSGRVLALSLATPSNPTVAGQVSAAVGTYCHDSQVVTYTSGPNAGQQIAFACNGSTGLDIYNVTNKAAITRLSRTTYPGLNYCHQGWLSADRQYFYVNDELDDLPQTRVFNVSNLAAPTLAATFFTGVNTIDHNLFIRDGFIFESNYTSGLQIFDTVGNPTAPVRVGYFDTFPENDGATFDGMWNNYPYFTNNKVVLSDINRGFFLVDVTPAVNYLTFTFPNGLPGQISPAGGSTVRVNVAGRVGVPQAGSGQLHYNAGAGFVTTPMSDVGPGVFDATFPALPCGTVVSYYFSVNNTTGQTYTSPGDAPAAAYSTVAVSNLTLQVDDPFEAASTWTGGVAGDTATTGIWVRGNPNGTAAQPEDDHSTSGVNCWFTGQGAVGGAVGDADVDGGRTTLLSPTFDVSTYDDAIISYWRWYSNNQGGAPNADTLRVDVSNNNGTSWVNVETVGPAGPETGGGWFYHEFRLSQFAAPTAQLRLRVIAEDIGSGSVVEAAFDDFQIRSVTCDTPPCLGDLDDDGSIGIGDLSALLSDFGCVAACSADLDNDGDTDLADLTTLLSLFGSVCP